MWDYNYRFCSILPSQKQGCGIKSMLGIDLEITCHFLISWKVPCPSKAEIWSLTVSQKAAKISCGSFLRDGLGIPQALGALAQWSPTFLAPGNISWKTVLLQTGAGWGGGFGFSHHSTPTMWPCLGPLLFQMCRVTGYESGHDLGKWLYSRQNVRNASKRQTSLLC